ncbi:MULTISPECIES: DUF4176 domain-containing protein [Priestia]|uniref:DUF4176 domain-containing protein n=2 Tax=Priestia TaxID=2800373 RepID=A0A0L1MAG8_PRIMG|nr:MULTISPECIES: DUF4176 domain-containing protein [Priestia]AXI32396.1 DUF4176 domain-containing protein [Priestia megaterium]KNH25467.1 hypothetical protein ACS78_02240 [Priestia megaterium]MBY0030413.1 DUF4176 domain-containing protein [Priestia aryabhattai]PVE66950.1 DUF4176 domain-containing protein [Priestia megaterium]PVE80367.1 DUF4176 domain-containing protein [Priestia megaterium]
MNELDKALLLPIGSVVKLTNIRKLVMIYGRNQRQASSGKLFDYVAVPYPEGNITDEYNVFFNRNVIETIEHVGMQSEAELEMREKVENDIIGRAEEEKDEKH